MVLIRGQFHKRHLNHIIKISWKIDYLKSHSNLPGVNELKPFSGLHVGLTSCFFPVLRTVLCLCSYWRRVWEDWEWTWPEPTGSSFMILTGTPPQTHRHEREPGGLGRHARSPSTACWPPVPSRRRSTTGRLTGTCINLTYWPLGDWN